MLHIPTLAGSAHKANPFPLYARLRHEAPVARFTAADKRPAWLIARYADVAEALRDPRLAKNALRALTPEERKRQLPWMPSFLAPATKSLLDQDPPDHNRLRSLVHQAFTPARVDALSTRIETLASELAARARAQGSADFLDAFAAALPMTVICEMLGVPVDERRRFRRWMTRALGTTSTTGFVLALPMLWRLMRYLRSLIRRRRDDGAEDLLSALIRAEQSGSHLSDEELLSMVLLLLIAGQETTANLIASGMLALLDQPDAYAQLAAEPALVGRAVEELLRFTSPVDVATDRYTTDEVVYGGCRIPRGQRIFALIGSANRDDDVFEQPDRLVLDRDPNKHLAFGGGPHFCLGAALARIEGRIAFNVILRDLPGMTLAVPRESLTWKPSQILRGLSAMPVRFSPGVTRVDMHTMPNRPLPTRGDAP
jgi:cytochrome P450